VNQEEWYVDEEGEDEGEDDREPERRAREMWMSSMMMMIWMECYQWMMNSMIMMWMNLMKTRRW
jgi:hypothetical protein